MTQRVRRWTIGLDATEEGVAVFLLPAGLCPACTPVPDWLKPWLVVGAIGFFLAVLAWATWTRRGRR